LTPVYVSFKMFKKDSDQFKVAISSSGRNLEDKISDVFARCPYFIFAEIENQEIKKFEAIKNEGEKQLGQAGVSVSQLIAEKDVEAVITKNIGPRASDVLNQFNIDIYIGEGAVEKILQEFIEGKLKKIN